jgi:hypothetical protein
MRTTRIFRFAKLALGLGFVITGAVLAPSALAFGPPRDDLPDLTLSQTTSAWSTSAWGSGNFVDQGGPVTYSLTVKNPSIQVWDPELHRYYTGGAPASGIVVRESLPDGSRFNSASGDSGFSCSYAYGAVTCTGGALQNGGTGHITINTNAPVLVATYPFAAVVDPNNTIAERNEANNTAGGSLVVDLAIN